MARPISEIQNAMIADIQNEPTLDDLNSPSATAVWRLWTFIFATAINIHEQFIDLGVAVMEQIARDAVPGTPGWLQRRVLEFQYSEENRQIVNVQPNGSVGYNTVDESLRIITRCAIVETENGVVVKVAKGTEVLEALNENELNALRDYVDKIGFAGVFIRTESLDADIFKIDVKVNYSGQFIKDTVQNDIVAALNVYLADLSINQFNGTVVREFVVDAIQKVPGVVGVDTQSMLIFGKRSGQSFEAIQRTYDSDAGYLALDEVDSIITMIPQNGV
jgi:hypothetical protein